MKLILDTNIFVSAFITRGKAQHLFNNLNSLNPEIYISSQLLHELELTFKKPKLLKYIKGQNIEYTLTQYIEQIKGLTRTANPTTKINLCRDSKDNMLLELAYFSQVDYIVTGDKDLLVLDGKSFNDYTFTIVDINKFLESVEE